jgi:hypothetical protein
MINGNSVVNLQNFRTRSFAPKAAHVVKLENARNDASPLPNPSQYPRPIGCELLIIEWTKTAKISDCIPEQTTTINLSSEGLFTLFPLVLLSYVRY